MLPMTDWLLLASVCALGAMTPGISLAIITRHTLQGGPKAGAIAGLTHALGVGLWAIATVAGLGVLFAHFPSLEMALSVGGALCLLWMASKSWQAGKQPPPATLDTPSTQALHAAAIDGFNIAFLNPKVALFFLALFSQFLHSELSLTARTQMVLTSMSIDGLWYIFVALTLGRSRLLPWLREHHHWVERSAAVLLVVVAVSVLGNSMATLTALSS